MRVTAVKSRRLLHDGLPQAALSTKVIQYTSYIGQRSYKPSTATFPSKHVYSTQKVILERKGKERTAIGAVGLSVRKFI